MGLFSSSSKNKQEASGEDSGYYRAQDDRDATERAKSKRASNAGGGATRGGRSKEDPVLPEKKRARRRLVGAIALALAVAVGLPMILDSEPKPLASDIAIQIPSKDKATEPLVAAPAASVPAPVEQAPAPAAPAPAPAPVKPTTLPPVAAVTAPAARSHTQPSSLDKGEEFVDLPKPAKPADTHVAKAPEPRKPEPKQEPRQEARPEHKSEPKKPEPAKETKQNDDARAMAILEGKPAEAATRYVVQIGAYATQERVNEVQDKLKAAGIKSFVQKVTTSSGELTRVKLGPFANKEEADKAKAKLGKIGLDGKLIPA